MKKVITFEIEEETKDELESRFEMLKKCARRKIILPEAIKPDRIDAEYYELLCMLYGNWKSGHCSEQDTIQKGKNYRNMYVGDKELYARDLKCAADMCHRRKLFTQISAGLIKGEFGAFETFNKLFELIAMATEDDVTANMLRETAGFQLITGCGKHTEDEIKELKNIYGWDYHGKGKVDEGEPKMNEVI